MHITQTKILEAAKTHDVLTLGLRPLGKLIGEKSPQVVKHHLMQLQKKGLLMPHTREAMLQSLKHSAMQQSSFTKIPILGNANCGEATYLADERVEGYITVSKSLLEKTNNIFALVAKGDSMNEADIDGNNIEEGDYVIIDASYRGPRPGDYVLSIIEGCANIKKFARAKNGNVVLLSESSTDYSPIYIDENDQFLINGRVAQVIKAIN
jgi:repressor LexA